MIDGFGLGGEDVAEVSDVLDFVVVWVWGELAYEFFDEGCEFEVEEYVGVEAVEGEDAYLVWGICADDEVDVFEGCG